MKADFRSYLLGTVPYQPSSNRDGRTWLMTPITHLPSGWPKKSPNFIFTTKMVFTKSLKSRNSGSETKGQKQTPATQRSHLPLPERRARGNSPPAADLRTKPPPRSPGGSPVQAGSFQDFEVGFQAINIRKYIKMMLFSGLGVVQCTHFRLLQGGSQ